MRGRGNAHPERCEVPSWGLEPRRVTQELCCRSRRSPRTKSSGCGRASTSLSIRFGATRFGTKSLRSERASAVCSPRGSNGDRAGNHASRADVRLLWPPLRRPDVPLPPRPTPPRHRHRPGYKVRGLVGEAGDGELSARARLAGCALSLALAWVPATQASAWPRPPSSWLHSRFAECVRQRESGNGSGSSNIYGMLDGWAVAGGRGRAGDATRAEQDYRAYRLWQRYGASPWRPYDGC